MAVLTLQNVNFLRSKVYLLPERGSLVFTASSSSTDSSSASWDALSDIDSLFSLPRLTILRKDGRLEASTSHSVLRFPQGKLSLRSSLRRPVNLNETRHHCQIYFFFSCSAQCGAVAAIFGMPCIPTSLKRCCCERYGTVKNSSIHRAQQVHNLPLKNKRGLHRSTCCIANYVTLQEISTLYATLLQNSEGKAQIVVSIESAQIVRSRFVTPFKPS